MVEEQSIAAVDGSKIPTAGDTVCIHGDGPEAVRTAETIRTRLDKAGVSVKAFGRT